MTSDDRDQRIFYTSTMAAVYAEQGNYAKARTIYRYLLDRKPQQVDLKAALAAVEKAWLASGARRIRSVADQWIELVFLLKRLRMLKQLRSLRRRQ